MRGDLVVPIYPDPLLLVLEVRVGVLYPLLYELVEATSRMLVTMLRSTSNAANQ